MTKKSKKIVFKCEECGTKKEDYPSNYKRRKNHFCCRKCQVEWQKKSRMGEKNPYWNNNKDTTEYQRITVNGKRKYLHRHKMEQKLGRPLEKDEEVHHIDGNRQNNAIENLYLCKNRKEHRKYHRIQGSNYDREAK